MEFLQSKTYSNLARSYAGECMAGMRYQILADMAQNQGYKTVSDELKYIAKNETMHAKRFFQLLLKYAKEQVNIDVNAGYPFDGETLESGLKKSIQAEDNEGTLIYRQFAKDARKEGYEDVATVFELAAEVELIHRDKFAYLSKAFDTGTLYTNAQKRTYVCSQCGHTYEDYEAWKICPLCNSSQGFVEIEYPYEKNCEEKQDQHNRKQV